MRKDYNGRYIDENEDITPSFLIVVGFIIFVMSLLLPAMAVIKICDNFFAFYDKIRGLKNGG